MLDFALYIVRNYGIELFVITGILVLFVGIGMGMATDITGKKDPPTYIFPLEKNDTEKDD
ncbi:MULTISPECIES: hypothetical protein [Muribaculum]|jgi:hypothetical protein|uniref:Uncharacterized protein n=1 Tax=Muribaculum caecicola TaxID=3038144 RepID=A0AC61S2Y8_9BACT|nr:MULTISPECIES: hypothetical protein [Muribaculum]THG43061.1 hypothetical protein E5990_10410 [Muribaculum caecicola]